MEGNTAKTASLGEADRFVIFPTKCYTLVKGKIVQVTTTSYKKVVEKERPRSLSNEISCLLCKREDHMVWKCDQLISKDISERKAICRNISLCFRCLDDGHVVRDCKVKFLCDVGKCGRRHHRLLHDSKN